jgi:hypothetical protein
VFHSPERHEPERGFGPDDFDPGAVSARFGAQFGTLAAPPFQSRCVAQFFSDSGAVAGQQPVPSPLLPVTVTVRHRIEPGVDVDVVTRHRYPDGTDLADHMWWSLVDLRIANAIASGPTDPAAVAHEIALRARPAASASHETTVDGESRRFMLIVDDELAACGVELEDAYVAAVAPSALVDLVAIRLDP